MTPEEALKRMKDPGEWTLRFAPRSAVSTNSAPPKARSLNFAVAAAAVVVVGAVIALASVAIGSSSTTSLVASTPTPTSTNSVVLRGEKSPWNNKTVDWMGWRTVEQLKTSTEPSGLVVGTIEEVRPGREFKFRDEEQDPSYSLHTAYVSVREEKTTKLVWIEVTISDGTPVVHTDMSRLALPTEPLLFLTTERRDDLSKTMREVGETDTPPPGKILEMRQLNGLYLLDGKVYAYLLGDYSILQAENFSSLDDLEETLRTDYRLN
jgi:hypothetical protein